MWTSRGCIIQETDTPNGLGNDFDFKLLSEFFKKRGSILDFLEVFNKNTKNFWKMELVASTIGGEFSSTTNAHNHGSYFAIPT